MGKEIEKEAEEFVNFGVSTVKRIYEEAQRKRISLIDREAEEWAQDHWDDVSYHGIDGFERKFTQELSRSAGAIGYVSGYEAAQRSAKPIWAQVYWEGFENGRKAAQPCWISVKERLPRPGELTVIYMPDRPIRMGQVETDVFNHGDWCNFAYEVTHWLPILPAPEEEE